MELQSEPETVLQNAHEEEKSETQTENSEQENNEEAMDVDLENNVDNVNGKDNERDSATHSGINLDCLNKESSTSKYLQSSDDEDDVNVTIRKSIKGKRIINSDSESDNEAEKVSQTLQLPKNISEILNENNSSDERETHYNINSKKPKRIARFDDSSEDDVTKDTEDVNDKREINSEITSKKFTRIASYHSDSEDETPITPHNKSFSNDVELRNVNKSTAVYRINEKGDLIDENNFDGLQDLKSRTAALCDSESSEDEMSHHTTYNDLHEPVLSPQIKRRAKKQPLKDPKEKKMTAKEALKQREEIRSESQRMLRESRVSLPYHKPKSHSIKEFLQRRPRLSLLKTVSTPPSVAIKMTTEQLKIVTEKLKEREKEVEKFYKSDSEPEEENAQEETSRKLGTENNSNDLDALSNDNTKEGPKINSELIEGSGSVEPSCHDNGDTQQNLEELESAECDIAPITLDLNSQPIKASVTNKINADESIKQHVSEGHLHDEIVESEICRSVEKDVSVPDNSADKTERQSNIVESSATNNTEQPKNILEVYNNSMECDFHVDGAKNSTKNIATVSPIRENEDQSEGLHLDDVANPRQNITVTKSTEQTKEYSAEYDFHLDDVNDSTENATQRTEVNKDDSEEYDFHLDDVEDTNDIISKLSEQNKDDSEEFYFHVGNEEDAAENISTTKPTEQKKTAEEEHLERLLKKYNNTDASNDNFSCPENSTGKKLNKFDLLKQLGTSKPRLSGGPDQEIDLDEGISKPSGVAQLMERFMQHAAKKHNVRNKIQMDVINLTQGEVHKETVSVSADPEEDALAITEKPGIKLQKLRNELQSQMAQRRSELWQQRQQPVNSNENKDIYEDEKSECGADEDYLDDEEEAELTEGETTEDEDIYGNEASETSKNSKTKSAFVDDEAEESDADDNEDIMQNDASENEEEQEVMDTDAYVSKSEPKKPLKRILKGFTEDSDDDEEEQNIYSVLEAETPPKTDTNVKDISTASTETWEDDEILPPNQPRPDKTPHKEMTQSKPDLGFLTPVIHLTALQGLNSGSKFLHESPVFPFSFRPEPSPLRDKNFNTPLQKKLFSDSCDTLDSESNMEDIAQLCSGRFPTAAAENVKSALFTSGNESPKITTQDLASICSGEFSGVSVNTSFIKDDEISSNIPHTKNCPESEDHISKESSESDLLSADLTQDMGIKDTDDDDKIISQLLDEEEMEQFKKKFDSPVVGTVTNNSVNTSDQEVQGGGVLFDSSDDETEERVHTKNVKKLHKKLTFSDDELNSEDDEKEEDNNVEIDLYDDLSEADDEEESVNKIVDYDSEENEIEFDEEEAIQKKKLKASDFFENEAELSESDWDSADEDEKGLDMLEMEQGDKDVFDENKIRSDLEKIHMRRVLDQDNQEIKILQELLLEDGELHGTGRQRQFRWRNLNDVGNEDNTDGTEVEAYMDEEESEEQWRRARHQREMFLKSKQEKQVVIETDDLLVIDSDSQVLKLGQEVVRKSLSSTTTIAVDSIKNVGAPSPLLKKPLMLMSKRGSFLSRNDKFLNKLAELTKVTDAAASGAPKNSKRFVFQTVSDTSDRNADETTSKNKKRKAIDKTPSVIKKLRLSSGVSPVVKSTNSRKQLFE